MELKNSDKQLIVNTIRTLSMDAVQQANSGHPGTAMALAPLSFTIYNEFLKFNPENPDWPNRDRLVLSAGHASMLLYATLHVMGYDLSLEDIKNFRQLHSKTAGHPEYGFAFGVEMTTGPLGQGIGTSVGMAIAEKWLKHYFNRPNFDIIDYYVYAIASDGCIMEGISHEAASLAGHLGLDNLIWIYDNNSITIEGSTALAFSENIKKRFEAYDWFVQHVADANDLAKISTALSNAKENKGKPNLIILDSHIAYGAPNKQDTADAHGAPLGEDEIREAKKFYGCDPEKKFFVPDEVREFTKTKRKIGAETEKNWNQKYERYKIEHPKLAEQFEMVQNRDVPAGWFEDLPEFPADAKGAATRKTNGQILNLIAKRVPWFLGGAADLSPSTKTLFDDADAFNKDNYKGRNFHFGIREHAMGAIVNGMTLSKLRAFGATFFVFSDYMRPAIRLAALMKQPSLFIFTHDSIGLGEDGPTHQPIEHLASLRAMPELEVIRPADANELASLWRYILTVKDHPIALVLTRQNVPTFDRSKFNSAEGALNGAYVVADSKGSPELILMSTGSEVHLCIEAFERLNQRGINSRVVSMPSWTLFENQSAEYKAEVLPESVTKRVAVEAGAVLGWHKYAGSSGIVLGLNEFGASAPYQSLYEHFEITADQIVRQAERMFAE